MNVCKFCKKLCKNKRSLAHHQRLCPSNEDRNYVSHTIGIVAWNKGLTKETDKRILQSSDALKHYYTVNEPNGFCSKSFQGSDTHIAASVKGGGYRENAGRSKKFKVTDSFGKLVTLQSTFELLCSKLLNELNIKWIRPKAIKYDNRNYFADFYLPDFDVWLDPKNNYKAQLDAEKIEKVINQNNIKLFVLLEHQLTKDYLLTIIK